MKPNLEQQLRDALAAFIAATSTREAGQIGPALQRVLELEKQLPAESPQYAQLAAAVQKVERLAQFALPAS